MKTLPRITFSLLLLSLGFGWSGLKAQQDPMFTQYFSNQLLVNPAYAGSRDGVSIVGLHRHQWTGFAGAPVTQTLGLHAPIGNGKSSFGGIFLHDKIGITERFAVNAAYAYRIDFGVARLAFGLHGQVRLRQMRWDRANPLEQSDASIQFTRSQMVLPNFGAGIYFDTERFFLGFAAPHLLENELAFAQPVPGQDLSQLRRHFFLSGGLIVPLTDAVKLRPMFLGKYVSDAPMEFDLSLGALIKERLLLGATYRTNASADLFAQFQITELLRLGYAYDFSLTRLQVVNSGSHEIMVGFDLRRRKNGFDHPRYF